MSVGRSLAWMGSSQIIALLLQFAAQVVLARYLSLHDAGIYAVALAVVGVLALIQTLGLQALIVREEVLTTEVKATAFTINALISVVLALAIAGVATAGGRYLGDPGVQRTLLVLAVTPLLSIPAFLPASMLEREGRFKSIALAGTAGSIAGTSTTIVLVVLGFSYLSVAYAQWANAGVVTVVMIAIGRTHARPQFGLTAWRRVADFGLQMLAVSGINALSTRLSDILLARFLGLSQLGLYSRASSLNQLIWVNVHVLIGRVMLVDFSEIHRSGRSLRERYLRTVDVVTAVLWPAFAGFAVLAAPFIQLVYGARWVPAATPLMIISLSSMAQVAITMTWELFAATGELRTQTRIEFIRSIVALGAFAIGCTISLEAAAAARVVDTLFALVLYRPHLNRMTDTTTRDFYGIYGRNALLTVVAIAPAVLLRIVYDWSAQVPVAMAGASILLGGGLWLGALFALRHPALSDMRRKPAGAAG